MNQWPGMIMISQMILKVSRVSHGKVTERANTSLCPLVYQVNAYNYIATVCVAKQKPASCDVDAL